MPESSSICTSLLGKKVQVSASQEGLARPGAAAEIVCIHQDNGGNLRYTLLLEDGRLLCLRDDGFKVVK